MTSLHPMSLAGVIVFKQLLLCFNFRHWVVNVHLFYCRLAGACDVIMPRFVHYLTPEKEDELRRIANAIVAPGKGILAADESTGNKQYSSMGVVVRERGGTPFRQIFWSRNGAPANIAGHSWNANTEAFRQITSYSLG